MMKSPLICSAEIPFPKTAGLAALPAEYPPSVRVRTFSESETLEGAAFLSGRRLVRRALQASEETSANPERESPGGAALEELSGGQPPKRGRGVTASRARFCTSA